MGLHVDVVGMNEDDRLILLEFVPDRLVHLVSQKPTLINASVHVHKTNPTAYSPSPISSHHHNPRQPQRPQTILHLPHCPLHIPPIG